MEKHLTPEEFAERLRVHPKSVRLWLREGTLRGVKIGRLWRIAETEAQRFVESSSNQASA
jgi:acetyl-CoA synthetase